MSAPQDGREAERADVLAYLRQRQRAATLVAARNPEEAERAHEIARSIGIQIEHIEAGLHEDSALVERAMGRGAWVEGVGVEGVGDGKA